MTKTIIITGAAGALGSEAVRVLSKEYNVTAICHGEKPATNITNVNYVENCNLSQIENAINIFNTNKTPYAIINIAGAFIWKEIKDTDFSDIENMFNINFKTMFNMTKAALPYLEAMDNAHIINVGATAAHKADIGMAAYTISKSAVLRFSEALAKETSDNINVNVIMPSIIDTLQNRADMPDADFGAWDTTDSLVSQISALLNN